MSARERDLCIRYLPKNFVFSVGDVNLTIISGCRLFLVDCPLRLLVLGMLFADVLTSRKAVNASLSRWYLIAEAICSIREPHDSSATVGIPEMTKSEILCMRAIVSSRLETRVD